MTVELSMRQQYELVDNQISHITVWVSRRYQQARFSAGSATIAASIRCNVLGSVLNRSGHGDLNACLLDVTPPSKVSVHDVTSPIMPACLVKGWKMADLIAIQKVTSLG